LSSSLFPLFNTASATAVIAPPDCSSDGHGLQDTSAYEPVDMPPAVQAAAFTSDAVALRDDQSCPPLVKKRGRGRPPVYKLSDRRRAQLREVSFTFQCFGMLCTLQN